MKGKFLLIPAALALGMCLTSCSLVPEEEAVRTAPVVKAYPKQIHEFTTVQRGEFFVTERVTCRYVPVKTETLSFALGGEVVDNVLVQVGDMVEEGQLLAQLDLKGLDEKIVQAQIDLEEAQLRLANLTEQQDIERRRNEITGQALSAYERMQAEETLEKKLALEMDGAKDQLKIAQMTLESLNRSLAQRQIRAPFSGAITYVRDYEKGELSEFGMRTIVLSDSTVSLFRAETVNWDRFAPGDVYEITVDKAPYTIMVADEASLGIEPQEKKPGKRAYVYFVLQEPDFTLEEGDFGYIEAVLEYREDAIYIPIKAVKESEDKFLVFYLREDGLRAYKEVETGIRNTKHVEILSGLTEGEQIILD